MISVVSFGKSQATIQRRIETKNGLYNAEEVLRKSQNKYGRPNSSTYIQLKVNSHKDNPKYQEVSKKLRENAERYSEDILYRPYLLVGHSTKGRVKGQILVGNCGECAQAIQNEFFLQKKQLTVNVVMNVRKENGGFYNHAFNLSNIKKGVKANDPKSWGKESIVTDLWSGIAMKSSDAIKYYEDLFSVNPDTDIITFEPMPDSDFSIQNTALKYFEMLPKRPTFNDDIPYESLYD